jgi:WS/DGAT/MGAT family acyltransferase
MAENLRYENRMSDSDALMWTIEKDPMLRSTITAIALLDRAPDRDRLRDVLRRGARLIPRLTQRVRAHSYSIAPPRWEDDPNFDIDYHLRFIRAPEPGDLRSVLDVAQPIAMESFDRARPLWEATVVEGLADGGAALIMKVHHTITDGVGSVKLALVLFDLERDPGAEAELPEPPPSPVLGEAGRWIDALSHEQRRLLGILSRSTAELPSAAVGAGRRAVTDPVSAAGQVVEVAGSLARLVAPATEPLSPLMTGRSLSAHFDSLSVPMEPAKRAAKAVGGTLNDAFIAATAIGFARYHEEMGAPAEQLRLTMPISVRQDDTADLVGNQFVPARFPIPVRRDDPAGLVAELHDLLLHERQEPSLAFVNPLAGVLRRLPTSISTGVFSSMLKGVDLVITNVPGAPVPLFAAGARVDRLLALAPLTGAAANVALFSYLDDLHIGINMDPAAVTEPDRLVAALHAGWDDVLALAPARRSTKKTKAAG